MEPHCNSTTNPLLQSRTEVNNPVSLNTVALFRAISALTGAHHVLRSITDYGSKPVLLDIDRKLTDGLYELECHVASVDHQSQRLAVLVETQLHRQPTTQGRMQSDPQGGMNRPVSLGRDIGPLTSQLYPGDGTVNTWEQVPGPVTHVIEPGAWLPTKGGKPPRPDGLHDHRNHKHDPGGGKKAKETDPRSQGAQGSNLGRETRPNATPNNNLVPNRSSNKKVKSEFKTVTSTWQAFWTTNSRLKTAFGDLTSIAEKCYQGLFLERKMRLKKKTKEQTQFVEACRTAVGEPLNLELLRTDWGPLIKHMDPEFDRNTLEKEVWKTRIESWKDTQNVMLEKHYGLADPTRGWPDFVGLRRVSMELTAMLKMLCDHTQFEKLASRFPKAGDVTKIARHVFDKIECLSRTWCNYQAEALTSNHITSIGQFASMDEMSYELSFGVFKDSQADDAIRANVLGPNHRWPIWIEDNVQLIPFLDSDTQTVQLSTLESQFGTINEIIWKNLSDDGSFQVIDRQSVTPNNPAMGLLWMTQEVRGDGFSLQSRINIGTISDKYPVERERGGTQVTEVDLILYLADSVDPKIKEPVIPPLGGETVPNPTQRPKKTGQPVWPAKGRLGDR